MNINKRVLKPLKEGKGEVEGKTFFSKRVRRKNKKKAKKLLKKLNQADTLDSVRKTIGRITRRRGSLPYRNAKVRTLSIFCLGKL